jgi:hypothetical protein
MHTPDCQDTRSTTKINEANEMIFGTYSAQRAADDGLLPHIAAYPCRIKDLEIAAFPQVTCGFLRWGGWDSNPGPADYESAALTG